MLPVPLAGNAFGALAAREGAIVTVEKIVAPEVIRAHSYMTRVPAHAVRAVCEVPFGAHPLGCLGLGLPDGVGYIEDRAFMLEARAAARSEETQAQWIRDWILDRHDHADYLKRLGAERVDALEQFSLPRLTTPSVANVTDSEKMIATAARQIARDSRARTSHGSCRHRRGASRGVARADAIERRGNRNRADDRSRRD